MGHLRAESVSKTFGRNGATVAAVQGASLEIGRGDFVAVTGHSGSGKTTLLSMLGGLARPSGGRILFEGADLYARDRDALTAFRREHVGFVFQFASLLTALTARENLLLPARFLPAPPDAAALEARALSLLERVGLRDEADAYPAQLSGGQQRRVAIARAFMNAPGIVLADEPTGDLDEETEATVLHLFRAMNAEGTAFVLVTHDPELARQAPRRLRMRGGRLEEA